jgi:DMSO/TMAO reductase YedYZ molybdopterin-dependent catalytic subunit
MVVAGLTTAAAAAAGAKKPAKKPAVTKTVNAIVPPGEIEINGDVAQPKILKFTELAILPQQTISVTIDGVTHTETGPYLESVLNLAVPNYLGCNKNNLLRWWALVSGKSGASAVLGVGEVDAGFGNRQAILSLEEDGRFLTSHGGPKLVVPGDGASTRDIPRVVMVTAGMAAPQLAIGGCTASGTTAYITPTIGSLIVNGAVDNPTTYTFAQLQAMPQTTQTVSFLSGTTPTTNTESGPLLSSILDAAGLKLKGTCPNDKLHFYVAITGSDGYTSILSYGEIDPTLGNRNPIVSLSENGISQAGGGPRILQNGDVKGGRAVSGTVAVTVFRVVPRIPVAGC